MMGALPTSALRRAALSLHALEEEDRDWILRALPGNQSAMLRDLLQELQELAIPVDGVPLEAWIEATATARKDVFPPFSQAAMQQLTLLLAAEPPRVRDVLLPVLPREWRCERPDAGAPTPATGMAEADDAPALRAAVLDAVRNRLSATTRPDRAHGIWQRMAMRLGKERPL